MFVKSKGLYAYNPTYGKTIYSIQFTIKAARTKLQASQYPIATQLLTTNQASKYKLQVKNF